MELLKLGAAIETRMANTASAITSSARLNPSCFFEHITIDVHLGDTIGSGLSWSGLYALH